jgi:hypothetical protein
MTNRILTTLITLLPALALGADLTLTPGPNLKATEVVEFQLNALRLNQNGDGIEATFRFASPANKSQTGPLSRFSGLFDNPQYSPMLNHISAEVELLKSSDNTASVGAALVDANGNVNWYQFDLSRQYLDNCDGCWMTDAVYRIRQPGNSA